MVRGSWPEPLPQGLLFGVEPMDPYTFAMAVVVLLDVAALASYVLGRRKAQVDSMTVLRYE